MKRGCVEADAKEARRPGKAGEDLRLACFGRQLELTLSSQIKASGEA